MPPHSLWTTRTLKVRLGTGGQWTEFALEQPFAIVGRHPLCDVPLASKEAPQKSFLIHLSDYGVYLVPFRSGGVKEGWHDLATTLNVYDCQLEIIVEPTWEKPPSQWPTRASRRVEFLHHHRSKGEQLTTAPLRIIGRQRPSHWRMEHQRVSRCQCALYFQQDRTWVIDLLSSRGTRVRGEAVRCAELLVGDSVELAEHVTMQLVDVNNRETGGVEPLTISVGSLANNASSQGRVEDENLVDEDLHNTSAEDETADCVVEPCDDPGEECSLEPRTQEATSTKAFHQLGDLPKDRGENNFPNCGLESRHLIGFDERTQSAGENCFSRLPKTERTPDHDGAGHSEQDWSQTLTCLARDLAHSEAAAATAERECESLRQKLELLEKRQPEVERRIRDLEAAHHASAQRAEAAQRELKSKVEQLEDLQQRHDHWKELSQSQTASLAEWKAERDRTVAAEAAEAQRQRELQASREAELRSEFEEELRQRQEQFEALASECQGLHDAQAEWQRRQSAQDEDRRKELGAAIEEERRVAELERQELERQFARQTEELRDTLQQAADERESLQVAADQGREINAAQAEELAELRLELEASRSAAAEAEQKAADEAKRRQAEFQAQFDAREKSLEVSQEKALAQALADNRRLQDELKGELENELEATRREADELRRQLEGAEMVAEQQNAALEKRQGRIAELEAELAQLNELSREWSAREEQHQVTKEQLENANRQLAEQAKSLAMSAASRDALERSLADLQDQFATQHTYLQADSERWRQVAEESRAEIAELEAKIQELAEADRRRFDASHGSLEKLEEMTAERDALQEQLKGVETARQQLQADGDARLASIAELQQQLDQLAAERDELAAEHSDLAAKWQAAQMATDGEAADDRSSSDETPLNDDSDVLRRELESSQMLADVLTAENEQLVKEAAELRLLANQLQSQVNGADELHRQAMKQKDTELHEALQHLDLIRADREFILERKEAELQELQAELERLRSHPELQPPQQHNGAEHQPTRQDEVAEPSKSASKTPAEFEFDNLFEHFDQSAHGVERDASAVFDASNASDASNAPGGEPDDELHDPAGYSGVDVGNDAEQDELPGSANAGFTPRAESEHELATEQGQTNAAISESTKSDEAVEEGADEAKGHRSGWRRWFKKPK